MERDNGEPPWKSKPKFIVSNVLTRPISATTAIYDDMSRKQFWHETRLRTARHHYVM